MPILLSSLKADLEREAKGAWIAHPDYVDDKGVHAEFNVSSLHLPAYTVARDLMLQRLAKVYTSKGAKPPQHVITSEYGKLYAKHILHGWRNFDISYTPELAAEMLPDPEFRNLVAAVEWCAAKVSDVDLEFVEEAGKNSDAPSSGN